MVEKPSIMLFFIGATITLQTRSYDYTSDKNNYSLGMVLLSRKETKVTTSNTWYVHI